MKLTAFSSIINNFLEGGKFISFFTLRLLLADEYNIRFNLSPLKLEWELCNIVLERDKNPMQTCLNTACDNITFVSVQHSSCERKDQCRTNTYSHTLTRIHRPIHIYMHTKRTILSLFTSGLKANGTVERGVVRAKHPLKRFKCACQCGTTFW